MDEFGEMLGDDPRLMSRYLNLIRRQNNSMRDRLSELADRQEEATVEMLGWIEIDEQQRGDLWNIVVELRLGVAEQLATDVTEFTDRVTRQMPLVAEVDRGTPAQIVRQAGEMTQAVRSLAIDCQTLLDHHTPEDMTKLETASDDLVRMTDQLESYLNQMQIEDEDDQEINDFIGRRLLENHALGATAEAWSVSVRHLSGGQYAPLASLEQHVLAIDTETLRVDMLDLKEDLKQQFARQEGASLPDEVSDLVDQVQQQMDSIVMIQVAATIASSQDNEKKASRHQQTAMARFDEAGEILDQLRRAVADALDEYDEPDPNIADLRDPTLDEFLARLEREPDIVDRLGLSKRRRNLRVNADSMLWSQQATGLLGPSEEAAQKRIASEMRLKGDGDRSAAKEDAEPNKPKEGPMSDEERERLAEAKSQQQEMEKTLLEIESQAQSLPKTSEQRQRLETIAKRLREIIESPDDNEQRSSAWQEIVQMDQAQTVLAAARRGETVPDEQWNKLVSALEDGLWQVRGKKPPEEYRKAIERYQDSLRELVGQ